MKAVGHAWSVKQLRWQYPSFGGPREVNVWRGGTLYNYGLEPPHYPVPSCLLQETIYRDWKGWYKTTAISVR